MTISRLMIFVSCVAMLFGCSNEEIKEKMIYKKTNEIESLVNKSQWKKADSEVKAIQNLFEQNKWKYQLLGDENEYSGLNQEISLLQVSINNQDKKEARRNTALIQDYLKSLYFH